MAVYGFGVPGQVPFTGYTNTLGTGDAVTGTSSGYAQMNGLSQGDDRIAKMLRNGGGTKQMNAVWLALTGQAPGQTALATKKQVQWVQGSPGGLIPIETITIANRATTAADRTAFLALIQRIVNPTTYPPDSSGNGGGGKQSNGAY